MFYEDAHLYKEALGMGKTNIALIDDTWHRVVAPIKQTEPCALVLWEPDSDHDTTQTWGKVVRPQSLSPIRNSFQVHPLGGMDHIQSGIRVQVL
jgi:hypothetical protein